MKRIQYICLLLLGLVGTAAGLEINESWDMRNVPRNNPQKLELVQAADLTYYHTAKVGNRPYNLSNLIVKWEIVDSATLTNEYYSTTGTVVSASSGMVKFEATPAQMNITNNTVDAFTGFIRVYDSTTNIVHDLLSRQNITFRYSGLGANYAVVTPTPYPWDANTSNLANFVLSDIADVSTNGTSVGSSYAWTLTSTGWVFSVSGSGDVTGPGSATSGNIASFDGATGKAIGDSGINTGTVATAITQAGTALQDGDSVSTLTITNLTLAGPVVGDGQNLNDIDTITATEIITGDLQVDTTLTISGGAAIQGFSATETKEGIVRKATPAEVAGGVETNTFVTPAHLATADAGSMTNFNNIVTMPSATSTGGTVTVDLDAGGLHNLSLTSNATNFTFDLSNGGGLREAGATLWLDLNGYTVAWDTNVVSYAGGSAPDLDTNLINRIVVSGAATSASTNFHIGPYGVFE